MPLQGLFVVGPAHPDFSSESLNRWRYRLGEIQKWARRVRQTPLQERGRVDPPYPCAVDRYSDDQLDQLIELDGPTTWNRFQTFWVEGSDDSDEEHWHNGEDGLMLRYVGANVPVGQHPTGEGYEIVRLAFACGLAQFLRMR